MATVAVLSASVSAPSTSAAALSSFPAAAHQRFAQHRRGHGVQAAGVLRGAWQGMELQADGRNTLALCSRASSASRRSQAFTRHGMPAVMAVASVEADTKGAGFDEMAKGLDRKFFMVGGKGGVGKTSLSAALAVKFAEAGHSTLIVSTDPAHSLSDSFAQVGLLVNDFTQHMCNKGFHKNDVSGGKPVPLEGTDLPVWALEVDPDLAKEEFRTMTGAGPNAGKGVSDFMDGMGLGGLAAQLGDLKLGELLDTPPPGLDEAVAIAKVVQIIDAADYAKFTRIIFDTAPTGHTLRLLSLPDFLDASVGKIIRLRQKLANATNAIKSVFGQGGQQDDAVKKLEELKQRLNTVRNLFRDKNSTEFVVVTIPTMMALLESSRLIAELRKEGVPVKRFVINQILPESVVDCKFCRAKYKDQHRAMGTVAGDANFKELMQIEAPMFDLEIRGVPALQFLANRVWV
eukprot:jgi/Chlat1/3961/Chrsp26S08870